MKYLFYLLIIGGAVYYMGAPAYVAPVAAPEFTESSEMKTEPENVKKLVNEVSSPVQADKGESSVGLAAVEESYEEELKSTLEILPELSRSYAESDTQFVFQLGRTLKRIRKELREDPSSYRLAANFYEGCAQTNQAPLSVRANCWSHLEKISEKFGYDAEPLKDHLPPLVLAWAKYVSDE